MSRPLVAEALAQLGSQSVKYAIFAEMFFTSGTLRLHNALGLVNATEAGGAARDWQGTGDLGSIGAVRENAQLQSAELALTLSGLDSAITAIVLNESPSGRVIVLYLGVFDSADKISGNLSFLWRGRMDRMSMSFGAESNAVTLSCENEATTLLRTRNGYFTDATQQQRYAGDRGLEYLPQMPFLTIQWAGKTVTNLNPRNLGGFWLSKH